MTQDRLVADSSDQVWRDAADCARRWQRGDDSGLDDLVRLLSPVLWQVVRAYGLDRDLAEDVVQTTWLRLVRHRTRLADAQAVGAWLTTTARREAARVAERSRRDAPMAQEDLPTRPGSSASAEAEALANGEADRLWGAVRLLSERCRQLLRVIAFSERPQYADLATELNMPIGSIGPTRGRCLDKLRSLVAAQEPGASA